MFICMIRFIGEEGVRGSEEMQHMEHDVVIKQESARKEREAGSTSMEDITTSRRSSLDEHEHVMAH
jgi:hypothetical protein